MTNQAKQRDATFDIMKGIGILLVITAHFFSWDHPVLGRFINSFHMPMFFIVAGFFSKSFTTAEEVKPIIKKYAKRLLPAFAFTQIIIILWAVLMAFTKEGGSYPIIRETLSLFWADPHGLNTPWGQLSIGVIWFLVALFLAKTILLLLSRLKGYAISISIALAIGAVLLHRVFPYSIWCISVGLTALPFVTIGWWFRTHTIPTWFLVICILCWIAAILFSHLVMYDLEWGCFPIDFLGACGGSFCLFFLSKFINNRIRGLGQVLAILGIWSLAIMCFHDLEMYCRLSNHFLGLFNISLPIWGKYVFRYFFTIAMAGAAVNLPIVKRVFS